MEKLWATLVSRGVSKNGIQQSKVLGCRLYISINIQLSKLFFSYILVKYIFYFI